MKKYLIPKFFFISNFFVSAHFTEILTPVSFPITHLIFSSYSVNIQYLQRERERERENSEPQDIQVQITKVSATIKNSIGVAGIPFGGSDQENVALINPPVNCRLMRAA